MITIARLQRFAAAFSVFAAAVCMSGTVGAQTIIESWNSATPPSPPPLKAANVDPKTTALLALDFLRQNCSPNPACVAAVPVEKALVAKARAAGAYIVFTNFFNTQIAGDTLDVGLTPNDSVVTAWADKFIDTNLDAMLKAKGIKTVIITGTAANGAALYTGSTAAQRGYNVVVPVDLIPASSPYVAQFVTWQLQNGPTVGNHVTLTRASMISF